MATVHGVSPTHVPLTVRWMSNGVPPGRMGGEVALMVKLNWPLARSISQVTSARPRPSVSTGLTTNTQR